MTLGLIQPPRETSTRYIILGGKGGRCIGLTTLPPSYADHLEIKELQLLGILRACQVCYGIALPVFGMHLFCVPRCCLSYTEHMVLYHTLTTSALCPGINYTGPQEILLELILTYSKLVCS